MGYHIYIGEHIVRKENEAFFHSVIFTVAADAPVFICAGNDNFLSLSYTDFRQMAQVLGGEFAARFCGSNSWISSAYPCGEAIFPVNSSEIAFFEQTLAEYQARSHKPSYAEAVMGVKHAEEFFQMMGLPQAFLVPGYDWISDRLNWFIFWMKRTLVSCRHPVVFFH